MPKLLPSNKSLLSYTVGENSIYLMTKIYDVYHLDAQNVTDGIVNIIYCLSKIRGNRLYNEEN